MHSSAWHQSAGDMPEHRGGTRLRQWEPGIGLTTLQWEMQRPFEVCSEGGGRHGGEQMTTPAEEVSDTTEAVIVPALVPGITRA